MGEHCSNHDRQGQSRLVPLFPLPNVVLFPRAVLPLHIFEQRYRQMTADALAGDRCIAMALLKPGWEKNYHCRPKIDPVVCIGTIISHEKLSDGKYNFLLQGHTRASIIEEIPTHAPYRIARLQPLPVPAVMEIDLCNERQALANVLANPAYNAMPLCRQFRQMLCSCMGTAEILDIISFNLVEDICLKQKLLAETDPRHRAQRVLGVLQSLRPQLQMSGASTAASAN